MNGVAERVRKLIAEQLCCDVASIQDSAKLADDLGLDSLDLVELAMAVEDEFAIVMPDEDIAELTSVQAAIDYIAKRVVQVCAHCTQAMPGGCAGMFLDAGPLCRLNEQGAKP